MIKSIPFTDVQLNNLIRGMELALNLRCHSLANLQATDKTRKRHKYADLDALQRMIKANEADIENYGNLVDYLNKQR